MEEFMADIIGRVRHKATSNKTSRFGKKAGFTSLVDYTDSENDDEAYGELSRASMPIRRSHSGGHPARPAVLPVSLPTAPLPALHPLVPLQTHIAPRRLAQSPILLPVTDTSLSAIGPLTPAGHSSVAVLDHGNSTASILQFAPSPLRSSTLPAAPPPLSTTASSSTAPPSVIVPTHNASRQLVRSSFRTNASKQVKKRSPNTRDNSETAGIGAPDTPSGIDAETQTRPVRAAAKAAREPIRNIAASSNTENNTDDAVTRCCGVDFFYCELCDANIAVGAYYHCSTCQGGDFDLCHRCFADGLHCYNDDHELTKSNIVHKDGCQRRHNYCLGKVCSCESESESTRKGPEGKKRKIAPENQTKRKKRVSEAHLYI
jgi:hypothetical protein